MPQFDQFSFFNQVSWFLLFFFNFYFFITYFLLPKICYNLKFRKKKIIFDNKKKNQINFEKNNIIFFFNNSYKNFCSNFELFITKKLSIYKKNQDIKIQETPIFNILLKQKINNILNQKFLLLKKIFIIIH
jgi:hypothetical protein